MRLLAIFLSFSLAFAAAAVEKNTKIATRAFSAVLPGAWEAQPSQDGMTYARGSDTLFITTLESDARKKPLVARIAGMRRKLIRDLARGEATCSSIRDAGDSERTIAYFDGEDPRNGKRFFVAVIGLRRSVVTTALYRPMSEPREGFENEARAIMWSVR